jgi:malate dehydrogenase (oxaloacetate-decarboxylating)
MITNSDLSTQAIALHQKYQGKLETTLKIPVNSAHDLSLAYTPGVGAVSREVAAHPERAKELTLIGRTVAIISNGTAVLGLGNIGPQAAMPVMEGKALLLKHFAGLDSFPLVIDAKNPVDVIKFVKQVAPTFCAINLEDIAAPACFEIEEALQDLGIPVFHDDQHGTAIVVAAALRNAAKVVGKDYSELQVGVVGAGAAGLAIAKMLLGADCSDDSCELVAGRSRVKEVIVFDSTGALSTTRTELNKYKQAVASVSNTQQSVGSPEQVLKNFDVVIGVSGPGSISPAVISSMADKPIVFAMANPDPEILPEAAVAAGACVMATGRSDFPNQINNVLAFPAVFKIAHQLQLKKISMDVKLALVEALASLVEHPTRDEIIVSPFYPDLVDTLVERVVFLSQ